MLREPDVIRIYSTRTGNLTLFIHKVRVQEVSCYSYTKYAHRKAHVICTESMRTGNIKSFVQKACILDTSSYSYTMHAYRKSQVIRTQSAYAGHIALLGHNAGIQDISNYSYTMHAYRTSQIIRIQCMHTGHLKLFVHNACIQDITNYSYTKHAYRTSQIIRTQRMHTGHLTLIPALRHLETASGTPGLGGSIIAISPTNLRFSSGKLTSSGSKANPLGNLFGGSTKSQKPGNERMIMITHICPEILYTLNTLKQKAILLLQTVASYKKQQQGEILIHFFFE